MTDFSADNFRPKPRLTHTHPDNPVTEYEWAVYCFRATAFRTAYDFTFAEVTDLTERFVRAIVHSSQPIPEYKRSTILAWYRGPRKGQKMVRRKKVGME